MSNWDFNEKFVLEKLEEQRQLIASLTEIVNQIEPIAQDVAWLVKITRDGNGTPPLIRRIDSLQEKVEEISTNLDVFKSGVDNRDKEIRRNRIAFFTSIVLSLISALFYALVNWYKK